MRGLSSVPHFIKWYPIPRPKRPADIKRNSLVEYGVDRINNDGRSPDIAEFKNRLLRALWKWIQDDQIQGRPLRINAFPKVIGHQAVFVALVGDDLKCDIAGSALKNKLSINTD